jgi:4'-phosphopantetheinyl transferase
MSRWHKNVRIFWLQRTIDEVPAGDEWLSAAERVAMARLHFAKRRADWRLGRWSAKCAVSAWLRRKGECAAAVEIEIRPAASGAPVAFVRGRCAGVALSLSHSHGKGFCAVADAGPSVGCDVEKVEARGSAFLSDYFTEAEQEMARACPERLRDELLTLLWSGKESALKAVGTGLRSDPRSIEIRTGPGRRGRWRSMKAADSEGRRLAGWWRSAGGYVWTVLAIRAP